LPLTKTEGAESNVNVSLEALSNLLREADRGPADGLPLAVRNALDEIGVTGAAIYILDYHHKWLQPAPGSATAQSTPEPLPTDGTAAGQACNEQRLVESVDPTGHRVWVPISERADCLGVLELEIDRVDDDIRRICVDVGVLLGHLIVTAHQYTDVYELLSRRRTMNLAAEMHWEIQPAMSYVGPNVAIAGEVEPAYEVGGDAFDYSVNQGVINFALLDAMGHGLEAALLSTQGMEAYRYARRRLQSIEETARTLERTFVEQFDGEKFVTGVFCRLDSHTGTFSWLNAGHHAPLLMRDGAIVEELETPARCPLGLNIPDEFDVHETSLKPGDAVLVYSDGVVEARSPAGEDFETERLYKSIHVAADKNETEIAMVRDVIEDVKVHASGPLRDDATLVMLVYKGA
jgi:serine phosphatase RsbU (regulator of sigma subunit)